MTDGPELLRVVEGAEPQIFKLSGFELPPKAQIQIASEAPYVVQFEPNPLDHSEGRFVFGRAGIAKVVLTWHDEAGKFLARNAFHFLVAPAHWSSE